MRRVDRFVADRTGLSRSYVQKLISEGLLVDDQGRRLRANSEVRGGAVTLEVPPAEVPYHLEPDPTIEIEVVYEDDDLLIVNKPSGLVVHPAPGHWRGTLVNALLARGDHYGGIAGVARPGIVHRLDRDTSGLLIVARNDAAQASVMAQLKARRVRKTYLALAHGSGRRPPWAGSRRPSGATPRTASGWPSSRTAGASTTGLPRPRALRGLDAPRAGPRHRSHAPDPRPPRGPGPPRGGRSGVRDGDLAQGAGRAGAPVPPRLAAGARVAVVVEAGPGGGAAPGRPRVGAGGPSGGRDPRPGGGRREAAHDRTGGPARRAGGAAGDHQRPVRGGQGHDHRRAARRDRATRLPLRRDLHHARPATRRGSRRLLPVPHTAPSSTTCATPASCSRPTRSTATGTGRRAARWRRRSPRATT